MKGVLFACLFAFSITANAGFLIEPYLGYSISSGEDGMAPATKWEQTALFFGARLGYQALGFMGGLDFAHGMEAEIEETSGGTVTKVDVDQNTFGAFFGYNFPIMLRVWGAYYFSSVLGVQSGAGLGADIKGSGYGLGVGYTGLPFVALNLEYRRLTFDEAESVTGQTIKFTSEEEQDFNQIMLSLSIPFDL